MIESRKENKELRDNLRKGDQDTIIKIKQLAKDNEEAAKKEITKREICNPSIVLDTYSPLIEKNKSSHKIKGHSLRPFNLQPLDVPSRMLNSNLEM